MLSSVHGFAPPDLNSVVRLFKNHIKRAGGGAALCIYHNNEPLLDIWAGEQSTGKPWEKNTSAVSFSTTKGVISTFLHMAMQEAHLDYDTQISHLWPSFKQENKRHLTIAQLLSHEAGMFNLADHIEHIHDIYDWDTMIWRLAKAKPSMAHLGVPSYHAITYGWLVGELLRRLTGQTPGQFLESEMRSIMGRHNFIGVPQKHLKDTAFMFNNLNEFDKSPSIKKQIHHSLNSKLTSVLFRSRNTTSALRPPSADTLDFNSPAFLQAQIPGMNGVFTARGLAKLYNMLALGGVHQEKALISSKRFTQIQQVQNTGKDRIIHIPMHWRLGYHRILNSRKKVPQGFGHYGYGGSGAWCDPSRNLAVGLVVNSLWGAPLGDYRMAQLAGEILRKIKLNPD